MQIQFIQPVTVCSGAHLAFCRCLSWSVLLILASDIDGWGKGAAFVFVVVVDHLIVVGYLVEMTHCILASLGHCMLGIKRGNKRRAVEKKAEYSPKVLQNCCLWTKTVLQSHINTHLNTHTHHFYIHKVVLYACTHKYTCICLFLNAKSHRNMHKCL